MPVAGRRALLAAILLLAGSGGARGQPALSILGRRLFGPRGDEIGRLVDVLVDTEGRPIAAIADVGGFMGIGMRRVALEWRLLRFVADADPPRVVVAHDADAVIAAPEYRPDDPTTIFRVP